MKIVIVSTFMNHYHAPLSEELYRLTNGDFFFIETMKLPDSFKRGGFQDYSFPYIIHAWENEKEEKNKRKNIKLENDVKDITEAEKEELKTINMEKRKTKSHLKGGS